MPGATKYAKVYLHKQYLDAYGETINPDISIEVFRASDSSKPSLYILFECKWSAKHTVNIQDYNEFETNISRLRKSAVKGYMVTNTGFSCSAINRSKGLESGYSTGIGLIVFNDNEADWIVERNIQNYNSALNRFEILQGEASYTAPILFVNGQFANFVDHLNSLGVPLKEEYLTIPLILREDIQNIAEKIGEKFLPPTYNRVETILKYINPSAKIIYKDLPKDVCGSFDFNNDVLFISNAIKNNINRTNFTIAHEIGHIVLHKHLLNAHFSSTSLSDIVGAPSNEVIRALEVQANIFAASLLLPKHLLIHRANNCFKEFGIRRPLFKDHQFINWRDCKIVCTDLSSYFFASQAAIELRLSELGLLKYGDFSYPKTLWEILHKPDSCLQTRSGIEPL